MLVAEEKQLNTRFPSAIGGLVKRVTCTMYRNSVLQRMYSSVDAEKDAGASSSGRRPLEGVRKSHCAVLIGHRGLKMNHRPDEAVRENTIRSLQECSKAGATYAEFDVQVLLDLTPHLNPLLGNRAEKRARNMLSRSKRMYFVIMMQILSCSTDTRFRFVKLR